MRHLDWAHAGLTTECSLLHEDKHHSAHAMSPCTVGNHLPRNPTARHYGVKLSVQPLNFLIDTRENSCQHTKFCGMANCALIPLSTPLLLRGWEARGCTVRAPRHA